MTYQPDRVLVAHAGAGDSTESVAEFIAARLRVRGLAVDVRGVDERPDLGGYDAVVLGSVVRDGALLADAEDFVRRNADTLRTMPVWLFGLGIGPSLRGPVGRLLRDVVPARIAGLCELVRPREYRAFAGIVHRGGAPVVARLMLWICGGRYGDLRDWQAIDAWTTDVAGHLQGAVAA